MPARWLIALAGTALHLCLGTVYAWSYFQRPVMALHGWSNSQAAWTFSLAICFLGLAAAAGGLLLPRLGARRLALAGALLFAAGHLIAGRALALGSLPLLWLGYGVVGGCGLGLCYVVPVAVVARWFPERKGLATGLVVMGFGLGALVMSKLAAPALLAACGGDLARVFTLLGAGYLVLAPALAALLREPPAAAGAEATASGPGAGACLRSWRFAGLWLAFACAVTAGLMLIGFQSPLLQDLLLRADPALGAATLAAAGGTLIAASSLANGVGRLAWGALSDRLGRARTLRAILALQAAAFALMYALPGAWPFAILACVVLLGYGGAFGTVPAFVLQAFGARAMATVYGALLTAWSAAGVAGPQLAAAIRDRVADPGQQAAWVFATAGAIALAGLAVAWRLDDRPPA
jgi:OFA family oxalate/formate antiporter-like MFS transporter